MHKFVIYVYMYNGRGGPLGPHRCIFVSRVLSCPFPHEDRSQIQTKAQRPGGVYSYPRRNIGPTYGGYPKSKSRGAGIYPSGTVGGLVDRSSGRTGKQDHPSKIGQIKLAQTLVAK